MSETADEIADRVLGKDRRKKQTGNGGVSADNQASKTWRDGLITAAELQTKQFKPVRIILPRLIPEGVTILAGKPKVGKSWLALDVCLAVADETRLRARRHEAGARGRALPCARG
jgi:predicted ATP-dependent serine protease